MEVSFVIPARNVAATVGATIRSVHGQLNEQLTYEIILVDNGSVDETRRIAADAGATVVESAAQTVSAVRNAGVQRASGKYVVFIDADVTLESGWLDEFAAAVAKMENHPFSFSGSRCSVPPRASWLERNWIAPRTERSMNYIGTGHFVVRREDFLAVGQFDESKVTGEDVALSQSLLQRGGILIPMPAAVACHHGNPRSLTEFIRRESWHGIGDCTSVQAVLSSRVALVALAVGLLHVTALLAALNGYVIVAGGAGGMVLAICVASSARAYGTSPIYVSGINVAVYYVYYLARLSSFFRAMIPELRKTWKGAPKSGDAAAVVQEN